jgi:hypothetical protein
VGLEHGEVVDVDLAPVLFELVELVGGEAADDGVASSAATAMKCGLASRPER